MVSVEAIYRALLAQKNETVSDIHHLTKVWGYARNIGLLENLDEKTQYILEVAAVVHDIACPFCREKYGRCPGKLQEQESGPLVQQFLSGLFVEQEIIDRVSYLVCHHHTYTDVDNIDYQILLEADYIVNAEGHSAESIRNAVRTFFRTPSGIELISNIYLKDL